ncbi:MAG: hypothetical protein VR65_16205 [Desulfobulbaceae bacterium BRH_c16a]|nr:MAG: hypothetical protein VR65_16205 [Desulfobulbaceae bacterium BRH_c16a]
MIVIIFYDINQIINQVMRRLGLIMDICLNEKYLNVLPSFSTLKIHFSFFTPKSGLKTVEMNFVKVLIPLAGVRKIFQWRQ